MTALSQPPQDRMLAIRVSLGCSACKESKESHFQDQVHGRCSP